MVIYRCKLTMYLKKKCNILFLIICVILFTQITNISCVSEKEYKKSFLLMDTVFSITLYSKNQNTAEIAFAAALERIKAIEAGAELPPEPAPPPTTPLDYLRRGLICLGIGLGLVIGGSLFAYFEKDPGILFFAMCGFVMTFIGAGLVAYYKIQDKAGK